MFVHRPFPALVLALYAVSSAFAQGLPRGRPDDLGFSSARLTAESFEPRPEVAFAGRVRRWIEERHPGGRDLPDGRYVVTYQVADAGWFVREVLQYGDGAEVLGPPSLREAVRRMVG